MNLKYTMRIAEILMQYKNVEVKEIKPTSVLAIINGIETLISGEICVCHGGTVSYPVAIVEHEDGSMGEVFPAELKRSK